MSLLLLLEVEVVLEIPDLSHLQIELQENLQKAQKVRNFGFGYNLKLLLILE